MNKGIPIFDSITHPTINGNWLSEKYNGKAKMQDLILSMEEENIKWGFAVGMKGVGDYNEVDFIKMIETSESKLIPVAYFDFENIANGDIKTEIRRIKKMGYKGIKIHPRLSNINILNNDLIDIVKLANQEQLALLLCTYFYDCKENSYVNNIDNLQKFLYQTRDCKMILLHSGSVRLLEMMEIARAYKNILLDLSLTLCKYKGSSLELDIKLEFGK